MKLRIAIASLFLGAFAGAVGCSSTTPADDADGGTDAAPTPSSSARPDGSAPRPDGSTAEACYDEELALALEGAAPTAGSGKCTDAQIAGFSAACLGASGSGCEAFIDANKDCSRCVIGPLEGDPANTPIGALLSVSDDLVVVNTASCAALVIGRADCALAIAEQETCLISACTACDENDEAALTQCRADATTGICKDVVSAACTQAIDARAAEWEPICLGTDFDTELAKVAKYLCGGSTDAGGGG